jgi:hypothetical protein
MTLYIKAKIVLQNAVCIKCDACISLYVRSDIIRCSECGALYELESSEIKDQYIEYKYAFVAYKCMHSTLYKKCDSECPAPKMYCKEHSNDEYIKTAENSIKFCEESSERAKNTLDRILESKRIWLIQELSGLNNEDNNSISEDEIGKDTTMEDMGKPKR